MTFAEYNTDEYFNNSDSTADGLVKAGYNEGKTRKEIEDSLSPLWKEDKKGNVKKALDTYYKTETAPKSEEKKEEVKETVKAETKTPENAKNKTTSEISNKDKNFFEQESGIADTAEDEENKRQREIEQQRWNDTMTRMQKSGEAFKNIDDHFIDQLPTFMFKRFENGEFGDPKSQDAQLRLAYFMVNGIQSKLKNAANVASVIAGKGQMFSDTTSDYEKYQATNLEEGMANRWNKYKQDTQAAIDLAKKEGEDEQELQSSVAKISSNNRLNTAFNMMNESQKVYTLHVLSKVGNEIGNMNNKDFINTLIGFATSGDNLTWQEAAELLIARFGKDAMGAIKAANEDGATDGAEDTTAGFGGGIGNNLKGYKTIDGETVDFSMIADKDQKAKLRSLMDDLSNRYYNEQIDEETFRKYYEPLYSESKNHIGTGSNNTDKMIELNKKKKVADINTSLNELNDQAKAGNISPSDYDEQFDNIKANLKKWGLNDKDLIKVEKSRLSRDKILKAVDKKKK